jgi:D-sedoheptulose 7-phosphate isomerase
VTAEQLLRQTLDEAIALHARVRDADPGAVLQAAQAIAAAIRGGGTLLVFGNGGSAADAQHAAAELVGRFQQERRALAAVALTADAAVLTSIGNDYGFDRVFARQV